MPEIIEGMADAIERRWVERYPTAEAFARAAGITTAGLRPVRKGYRKNYATRVRVGVARALDWPLDALDRILAGEDPASLPTVRSAPAPAPYEPSDLSALRAEIRTEFDELWAVVDELWAEVDELRKPQPVQGSDASP